MKNISQKNFEGERALFGEKNLVLESCIFDNGESPLKECSDIEAYNTLFRWKYPFWYSKNIKLEDCTLFDMARAGIWYTKNISVKNTVIEAPKSFRRTDNITLEDVSFTNAEETLWNCSNVDMKNVTAKGDYFAMGCENMNIDGLTLVGNYSFDGVKNMEIRNSRLLSKDAFWNTENVTVYDSFISGEYLGWNAKNLTLVNCTIESLQGMCYIDGLKMVNCKIIGTVLAFEYSENIDAKISSGIESVFNPGSGTIEADFIGELIIEKDETDEKKTRIICSDIRKKSDKPEWKR